MVSFPFTPVTAVAVNQIVAVVIPCYKVKAHILDVLSSIGSQVQHIYVVDDACPEQSGAWVQAQCIDTRVCVLHHAYNQGVGAAVLTGYAQAIADGAHIIVKIDGDGQMDAALIPRFISPIAKGEADYTKGNRFYRLEDVREMPPMRLFGNAVLSLVTKVSSGYWNIFDPTNGYTAIHVHVARALPFDRLSKRYFFESDVLYQLNALRAVVRDVSMKARYGDEISNLHIHKILLPFLRGHARNFFKRIFYQYFLRDFSIASLELVAGLVFVLGGSLYGLAQWGNDAAPAPSGVVMIAALPIILGIQFLLSFLHFDINSTPSLPIADNLPL